MLHCHAGLSVFRAGKESVAFKATGSFCRFGRLAVCRYSAAGSGAGRARMMQHDSEHGGRSGQSGSAYAQLLVWFPVHVAVMYLLMFAMIDTAGDFRNNLNMLWMAILMASPMTAIMLLSMRSMYPDRRKTLAVLTLSLVLGSGSWFAIREQWAVGDRQFLRSMIPHHSGAILMCREAQPDDPAILSLCEGIVAGQRAEIAEMERLLARP
jgi:hypothetical protein